MATDRQEFFTSLPFEDRWFMTSLMANSTWPQTGLIINILLNNELLTAQPGEIIELVDFVPTTEQRDNAERAMIHLHRKNDVQESVTRKALSNNEIRQLVDVEKTCISTLLTILLRLKSHSTDARIAADLQSQAFDLEAFLSDPKNKDVISQARNLLKIASDTIRNSRELSKQHLEWVRNTNAKVILEKSDPARRGERVPSVSARVSTGQDPAINQLKESILDAWESSVGDTYSRKFLASFLGKTLE